MERKYLCEMKTTSEMASQLKTDQSEKRLFSLLQLLQWNFKCRNSTEQSDPFSDSEANPYAF